MFGTVCCTCGGWLSNRCPLCAGQSDPGVTLEAIARGVRAVDRATSGGTVGSFDPLDVLRRS